VYIGASNPDNRREILLHAPEFEVLYDSEGVAILRLR
jgi:hypothetical protein